MRSIRLVRTIIVIGLTVIGIVLIAAGLTTPSSRTSAPPSAPSGQSVPSTAPQTPEPTTERRAAPTAEADVRDAATGPVLPESDPVVLSIPRIGVRSTLVALGLDAQDAMQVPRDPARAGWFTRSAAPGALGPAVIAGHVTWDGAPGVFFRLDTLRSGDRVAVTRVDGATAVFVVSKVARYKKVRFPGRAVYGAIDHAGLRLITCGGAYDSTRSAYPDNIVVFARLEAVRAARG